MSFSDFTTDNGTTINKSHFITLIQISRVDGNISSAELKMLHRLGRKFGMTEPEIDQLLEAEKQHEYHAPYSLEEKFSQIYNVASLILADNIVTTEEKKAFGKIAAEAGFDSLVIEGFRDTLFEGIRHKEDEEALFGKFKKVLFRK
jgi:uncharacterized tellurite resistance protein B-like protein